MTPNPVPDAAVSASPSKNSWEQALESLKGKVTAITLVIGTVGTIIGSVSQLAEKIGFPLGKIGLLVAGSCLEVACATVFIREVRRTRRPRPSGREGFIGANSFTEAERDRFFGRSNEIHAISAKLRRPELRYLILSGVSGCGKTSLIRAGLIPELDPPGGGSNPEGSPGLMHGKYIRLYNRPERSLRQALQEICPKPAQQGDVAPLAERSLFEELMQARERTGKPVVLFFDQFEEFFTNAVPAEEKQRFLGFVKQCIIQDAPVAKLVFAVRREFFELLSEFDEYVDEVFQKSNRAPLRIFDVQTAEAVIEGTLNFARGPRWSPGLMSRILEDLAIERAKGENTTEDAIDRKSTRLNS